MRPITAGELARMQRTLEATLVQTATVTIPGTPTKNAAGETVQGPPTIFTMPCRVTPAGNTGAEQVQQAHTESVQTWEIAYPRTFTVPTTASLSVEGITYEAESPIDHQAYETVRRIIAQRKG